MKKILLTMTAVLTLSAATVLADNTLNDFPNPVITAMPALSITPDARAAGLGEIGASNAPDLNSQRWNPAKYAYMESHGGITGNYTPWLRSLGVNDIDLAYLSGYYKWDDVQGIGASFTYFSYGEVFMRSSSAAEGEYDMTCRPNEWALDFSYYRKLHEYVSMSVALRFMYSDLNNGKNQSTTGSSQEMYPAWTMAADLGLYYKQPIELPMGTSYFNLGFTLQNMGGKMTWDKVHRNFIPTNFRIGASYELPCDKYNSLTFSVEATKLMVPTKYRSNLSEHFDPNDESTWELTETEFSNLSPVKGFFQSLCDAPAAKGYNALEEFHEVMWGAGIEYSYNRQFFARVGFSYEDPHKGNRRLVDFGAGFHLSIVNFDVSYTIAATSGFNPLNNTLRFTLGFDIAGIKDLVNNKK